MDIFVSLYIPIKGTVGQGLNLPERWTLLAKKYVAYAMSTTKQLSILGNLRTCVNLSSSAVAAATTTPISRLPKNTSTKMPMPSRKLRNPISVSSPFLYLCAVSKMTMAMASFRIDSPKMMVYSLGSTL